MPGSTAITDGATAVRPVFARRQLSPRSVLRRTPRSIDAPTSVPDPAGSTQSDHMFGPPGFDRHDVPPSTLTATPRVVAA